MNKAYGRINWENYPSGETPLNESNLNKMDAAIDEIDDRVIIHETTKATKTEIATLVESISFEESTGIFTIAKKNGSVLKIDTKLEKIAVNFSYDKSTEQIILTLIDGTKQYIDLSVLITQYEFIDTGTIGFEITAEGKVKATVLDGSITEDKLQPNYLADIKVEVAKAQKSQSAAAQSEKNAKNSENAAKESETNSLNSANKAESYAIGGTGTRAGEDTDNAKYYSELANKSEVSSKNSLNISIQKAEQAADSAEQAANSAASIKGAEENALNSALLAEKSAEQAANSAAQADEYANGNTNSAKYYYEQAKNISSSLSGGLRPMGTLQFNQLPDLFDAVSGDMYNISDKFVTNSYFKEGEGKTIPAGANVFKTADGYWDILAGTPVTGIKGGAETDYRTGDVNITLENLIAKNSVINDDTNSSYRYPGNIDDLRWGKAGCYWIQIGVASGTHPFASGYYMLEVVCPNAGVIVQKAYKFDGSTTYYRMYTNNQWYDWTKGISEATTIESGLMSASDKEKLDKIDLDSINSGLSEQIQESLKIIGSVDKSLTNTQVNLLQLAMVVQTMTDADVIDSDNVVIELFNTKDDIVIISGYYDSSNKRLYA